MALLCACLCAFGAPTRVAAQDGRAAPVPPSVADVEAWNTLLDDTAAAALSDLALRQREDKVAIGWLLLGAGLASLVVGGLIAGIGHEDETLLVAGLTTASWGAVNVAFALPLFDLGGGARERARESRGLRGLALLERRDELAGAQRTSGAIFALNVGLDVLYLSGAAVLMVLGAVEEPDERWMIGAGAAVLPQALFLLVFDVINWIDADARASELEAVVP